MQASLPRAPTLARCAAELGEADCTGPTTLDVTFKLPVYLLVWIEHYADVSTHHMETPEDPDRFNIVKFDLREDGRIRAFETAQSLSAADVSRLVGEILPTRTEL